MDGEGVGHPVDWGHAAFFVRVGFCVVDGRAQIFEEAIGDLHAAVEHTKAHPDEEGGMAPVYGMANTLPVQGVVTDLLERYLDVLYEV